MEHSPHIEFAGYTLEHPVYRHVNIRVQTKPESGVGGEQALVESLEMTQNIFGAVDKAMKKGLEKWPQREAVLKAEKEAEAIEAQQQDEERENLMKLWVAKQDKGEVDHALEMQLFGKVVTDS